MEVMQTLISILAGIGTVYTILKFYRYFYWLGLLYNQKFRPTRNFHKYGICIAARNEEKVIKNLLDSIKNQTFYDIEVILVNDGSTDNSLEICTDNTAEIVREFARENQVETIVYEHNNPDERTKGYALRYLFNQLKNVGGGVDQNEGYFIFDADNILASDYVTRMNESFDEGNEITVSMRNSKNLGQNWISFSYAIHWLRTCLTESRGKNLLKMSCRFQGTGILFANRWVKDGWNYLDLTEDREFCTDIVTKGGRIVYCEAAKFYDEQPYKLKVALRQRIRWAKGHLQSTVRFCPKLLRNTIKFDENSARSLDMFWLNFPTTIESGIRKILRWALRITVGVLVANVWGVIAGICMGILSGLLDRWIAGMIYATFIYLWYYKFVEKVNFFKLLFYIFMFPFFDIIGKYATWIALFTKVEWKPIPHDVTVDINNIK